MNMHSCQYARRNNDVTENGSAIYYGLWYNNNTCNQYLHNPRQGATIQRRSKSVATVFDVKGSIQRAESETFALNCRLNLCIPASVKSPNFRRGHNLDDTTSDIVQIRH